MIYQFKPGQLLEVVSILRGYTIEPDLDLSQYALLDNGAYSPSQFYLDVVDFQRKGSRILRPVQFFLVIDACVETPKYINRRFGVSGYQYFYEDTGVTCLVGEEIVWFSENILQRACVTVQQ